MVTIEVPAKLTVDDLITAVNQLPNPELSTFVRRVMAIQSQRELSSIHNESEKALLQSIAKQNLSNTEQKRLSQLRKKREEETLTDTEHQELLQFVEKIEKHDLERTKALVELAQKRNTTLSNLMHELGLTPNYA